MSTRRGRQRSSRRRSASSADAQPSRAGLQQAAQPEHSAVSALSSELDDDRLLRVHGSTLSAAAATASHEFSDTDHELNAGEVQLSADPPDKRNHPGNKNGDVVMTTTNGNVRLARLATVGTACNNNTNNNLSNTANSTNKLIKNAMLNGIKPARNGSNAATAVVHPRKKKGVAASTAHGPSAADQSPAATTSDSGGCEPRRPTTNQPGKTRRRRGKATKTVRKVVDENDEVARAPSPPPPPNASLRWDLALDDPELEAARLEEYRENRWLRYAEAAAARRRTVIAADDAESDLTDEPKFSSRPTHSEVIVPAACCRTAIDFDVFRRCMAYVGE